MRIGEDKAAVCRRHAHFIAARYDFLNRVINRCAVCFLGKICERTLPIVTFVQNQLLCLFDAVCIELNRDALRSYAVLVVIVVPVLNNRDFRHFGFVRVGQIHAVHSRRISAYFHFLDCVDDIFAVRLFI